MQSTQVTSDSIGLNPSQLTQITGQSPRSTTPSSRAGEVIASQAGAVASSSSGGFDRLMTQLGLTGVTFDQAVLDQVLADTHFDGLLANNPDIAEICDQTPKVFGPLLDRVKSGIEDRHRPVGRALNQAMDEDVIPKVDDATRDRLVWSLHQMWLLETIGSAMQDNLDVTQKVMEHLSAQSEAMGVRQENVFKTLWDTMTPDVSEVLTHPWRIFTDGESKETVKNWAFGAAKTTTIFHAMEMQQAVREAEGFSDEQELGRRKGLALNILEATLTDQIAGFTDNAKAGAVLMEAWAHGMTMRDGKIIYEVSDDWVTLYQCWNMAFILGNLRNMDILLNKLLAPMVSDVQSDEYLSGRSLLLYLSISLYLQRLKADNVEPKFPGQTRLAEILGAEARKFAEAYMATDDYKTAIEEGGHPVYERAVAGYVGRPSPAVVMDPSAFV